MEHTVIAVFDSYAQAESTMNELLDAGFSRSDVQLNPEGDRTGAMGSAGAAGDHQSHGSGIGGFFRSLFGMDASEPHGDIYSEAVRRGSCVVTVDAGSDEQRDRAIEVMNRHDPVDIDERSSHWRSQGWTGYDPAAPMLSDSEIQQDRSMYPRAGMRADDSLADRTLSESTDDAVLGQGSTVAGTTGAMPRSGAAMGEGSKIPVIEENLQVGKREVQRGGVRVLQRMTEKPVTESVDLREEHVRVERHPVDKPATEADLAAFREGQLEMREMAEEPIVSKDARVVEEVDIGKEVTQRTADINDTVRRTDVEVEQLGARSASDTGMLRSDTALDDSDFRRHWQTSYAQTGGSYDDYASAYRYGAGLSDNEQYRTYGWNDMEPQLRSDWERNHPESAWEKVKDAVRYGKERATGRH